MKYSHELSESAQVLTRRQTLKRALLALGGIATVSATAVAAPDEGVIHTAEAIHQEPVFLAPPGRVYEALMDAKQFQKVELLSGAMKESDLVAKPAEISHETGGAIRLFGGYITGLQIELVPGKRIVQVWRSASWPSSAFSIAKFELTPNESGTRIIFDHTGFPSGAGEHLVSGWKEHYWAPLQKFLS